MKSAQNVPVNQARFPEVHFTKSQMKTKVEDRVYWAGRRKRASHSWSKFWKGPLIFLLQYILERSLHWKIIETALLLYINKSRKEEILMSGKKINCKSIVKEEMSSWDQKPDSTFPFPGFYHWLGIFTQQSIFQSMIKYSIIGLNTE